MSWFAAPICYTYTFSLACVFNHPLENLSGLLSACCEGHQPALEMVGSRTAHRLLGALNNGRVSAAPSPVVLWQLELLAWLLADGATPPPDWTGVLQDLTGALFALVLDDNAVGASSRGSVQEVALSLLRTLSVLRLPKVPAIAIVHYRRFLQMHPCVMPVLRARPASERR